MSNKKNIIIGVGLGLLWHLTKGEKSTPDGETNNTITIPTCDGKEYLVNGKKVCETVLSDMGFVWIKHPTIPDGFYHYTDILNSERLSNADFLTWVKKGVDILQGPYHPNYTVYYTKMFNQGFKGTTPLQVANP